MPSPLHARAGFAHRFPQLALPLYALVDAREAFADLQSIGEFPHFSQFPLKVFAPAGGRSYRTAVATGNFRYFRYFR
jgi:hypothetical protein